MDVEQSTDYQVGEAIAQLQDGQVVTIQNVAVVNALTSQLFGEAAALKLAVRARWGAGGYTFTPLPIGESVVAGVQ